MTFRLANDIQLITTFFTFLNSMSIKDLKNGKKKSFLIKKTLIPLTFQNF
jgi:hypothetical protein